MCIYTITVFVYIFLNSSLSLSLLNPSNTAILIFCHLRSNNGKSSNPKSRSKIHQTHINQLPLVPDRALLCKSRGDAHCSWYVVDLVMTGDWRKLRCWVIILLWWWRWLLRLLHWRHMVVDSWISTGVE